MNQNKNTGNNSNKFYSNNEQALIAGKIPPNNAEIEEAILGSIMIEKSAFESISDILKPECFYVPANQIIFEAFLNLSNQGRPLDFLTVIEYLKKSENLDKVGGSYYVTKLTNSIVSGTYIEHHAQMVLEKFIQRELIKTSSEIMNLAYEDTTDVQSLIDTSENKIFTISNNYLKKDIEEINTSIVDILDRIEHLRNTKEKNLLSGIYSGFESLDLITNGWQKTDLIILAARPSMGKSTFALNLAINAALNPINPVGVGFFSLEMSNSQLTMRILSCVSEIGAEKISHGNLDDFEYEQLISNGVNVLSNIPIYLDDSSNLNIFEFRAKARRMVNKYKVGLIIIDYLQLMGGIANRNSTREQEISTISRGLKSLAKELKVPIIALSQLSRDVEKRNKEYKMPQLSDLRESGAIEQDADLVIFLYRAEYYNGGSREKVEKNEVDENDLGKTIVRIAKHRNGNLGDVVLRAILEIQKFEEWSRVIDYNKHKKNISVSSNENYVHLKSKYNQPNQDQEDTF